MIPPLKSDQGGKYDAQSRRAHLEAAFDQHTNEALAEDLMDQHDADQFIEEDSDA